MQHGHGSSSASFRPLEPLAIHHSARPLKSMRHTWRCRKRHLQRPPQPCLRLAGCDMANSEKFAKCNLKSNVACNVACNMGLRWLVHDDNQDHRNMRPFAHETAPPPDRPAS